MSSQRTTLSRPIAELLMPLIRVCSDFVWSNLPLDSPPRGDRSTTLRSDDSRLTLSSSAIRTSRSSSAAVSLQRSTATEKYSGGLAITLGCWMDEPGAEIVVMWSPASRPERVSRPWSSSIRLAVSPSNSREPLRLYFRHSPTTGWHSGSALTDSEVLTSTDLLELLLSLLRGRSTHESFEDFVARKTGTAT